MESRTLRSHRCIGAVADAAAPCASFYELGGVGFVAARVGRDAFQILKLDGLAFQCAGPRLGEPIAAIAGVGEWTYVGRAEILPVGPGFAMSFKATAPAVQRCKTQQQRCSYEPEIGRRRRYVGVGAEVFCFERAAFKGVCGAAAGRVTRLSTVGDALLLACGEADETTEVIGWARGAGAAARRALPKEACRFELTPGFDDVVVCHPPTYVNKILAGRRRRADDRGGPESRRRRGGGSRRDDAAGRSSAKTTRARSLVRGAREAAPTRRVRGRGRGTAAGQGRG